MPTENVMKTYLYGEVKVWLHAFLISELEEGKLWASRSCLFIPGERAPDTHCIGGWMDP
jgi:hypothetical protein